MTMRWIILSLLSLNLFAHPVTFKDGWVYAGMFMPQGDIQRIAYSVSSKIAIESNTHHFDQNKNYRDYALGVNYLFKRWLNMDSQGNIYGSLHSGYFHNDKSEGNVSHARLIGDWESRTIYTAGSIMTFYYDDEFQFMHSYRLGFAPYVAGMDTLQTWLIGKIDYYKENDRHVLFTPMMRFFYKNVLWEIGSNTRGEYFLTLMTHI